MGYNFILRLLAIAATSLASKFHCKVLCRILDDAKRKEEAKRDQFYIISYTEKEAGSPALGCYRLAINHSNKTQKHLIDH